MVDGELCDPVPDAYVDMFEFSHWVSLSFFTVNGRPGVRRAVLYDTAR
jgi:hypothetical protein